MPELPEVETIARTLDSLLKGKRVLSVSIYREKNILTDPKVFATSLVNDSFNKVERKGKFLLFRLASGKTILSHLRMEGKYYLFPSPYNKGKHDILSFDLDDNHTLVYIDTRKFGRLGLYEEEELKSSPIGKLGEDCLEISSYTLLSKFRQYKKEIKPLLMDQSVLSGIGNIYASEALFAARINPRRKANTLTLDEVTSLLKENRRIMEEAIALGGSTIRSYHPGNGIDGLMQNKLLVYGNNGVCPNCTLPIRRIFMDNRSTFYCPNCQKENGMPIVIAITGPIHSGKSSISLHLKEKGYPLFDCDKEISKLYRNKSVILYISSIINSYIGKNGKVDKNKLRPFMKDESIKKKVVDYLYPLLRKRALAFIKKNKNKDKLIFEIPLLKGSNLEDLIDYVIFVDSPISYRKERLEKEGKDASTLLKINSTYPLSQTKKEASFVLENDSSLESLFLSVDTLPIFY